MIKSELKKLVTFFDEREQYKKDLNKMIVKHGLANLSKDILRTVPIDRKALFEKPWRKNLKVRIMILLTAYKNASNEGLRKATNG